MRNVRASVGVVRLRAAHSGDASSLWGGRAAAMIAMVLLSVGMTLRSAEAIDPDLIVNSGTTTISTGTSVNITTVATGASDTGTLIVTTSGSLNGASSFIVGNGGTGALDVTGGYVSSTSGTIGNSAGSNGTATVSSGTWANIGDLTVGGAGTGTLTMTGGLVSVSGTLSKGAFGTINLNSGGTLQIGTGSTGGVLLGGTGSLTNNGTLILNRSDASIYSGELSGSGAVEKRGAGTLTLSGPNSYTGGTTLTEGTLALRSADAIGSSGTISFDGGTLQYSASNSADYSARFSNADGQQVKIDTNGENVTLTSNLTSSGGSFTKLGSGTVTLAVANYYSGGTTLAEGTLALGSYDAIGSSGTISFDGGTLQFSPSNTTDYSARFSNSAGQQYKIDSNRQNVTLTSNLTSPGGSFTKSGTGYLTLSGANTYSGGTTVSGGTLIGTTQSLQGNITNDAAVTFDQQSDGVFSGLMSGTGSFTKLGDGDLRLSGANNYSGGTTVWAGSLVGTTSSLQGNITNFAAVTFDQQNDGVFSGLMSGTGSFTKLGDGALRLSEANNYSGGTTVSAGDLVAGNVNAFGTGKVTVESGGTLDINGFLVANALVNHGGTILGVDAPTGTLSGINSFTATTIADNVTVTAGTTTFAGPISGTVAVGSDAVVKFISNVNASVTVGGNVSFSAPASDSAAVSVTSTGTASFQEGASYAGAAITNNGNIVVDVTSNFALGGVSGIGSVNVVGAGSVELNGVNNYSGTTNVTAGALIVNGSLTNSAVTIGRLGTASFQEGASIGGSAITNNGNIVVNRASNFQMSDISGIGSVTIVGTGRFALDGNNDYSGPTNVTAGTLVVNGSLTNSVATIGSDATLSGSGTMRDVVMRGGVLKPGNSPGALAAASLDLQAGSSTFMEVVGAGSAAGIAGTDYDQLRITTANSLTYGGSLNLTFGNSSQFLNGTVFDLFAFTGLPIGHFSSVVSSGTGLYANSNFSRTGGTWTSRIGDQLLSFSELSGRLSISGSAVPEIDPAMGGSALSLVAGVLAMIEQRRRRATIAA